MPDYVLTKRFNAVTSQLPDKVAVVITTTMAWTILKQLQIQLEQGKQVITVEIFGELEKISK